MPTEPIQADGWDWDPPIDAIQAVNIVPPVPGMIQNFGQPTNERTPSVWLDGADCMKHNGNEGDKPYAVVLIDSQTVQFEVRNGDHWVEEGSDVNRSEFHCYGRTTPAGTPVIYQYYIRFLTPLSSGWNVLGQNHDSSGSPPIALQGSGRNLDAVWRTPAFRNQRMITNFDLNRWYLIRIETNNAASNNGYVRWYVDGQQYVNYIGPIGDGEGTWWNIGLYRSASSQTSIVQYSSVVHRPVSSFPPQSEIPVPGNTQPPPTSTIAAPTSTQIPTLTPTNIPKPEPICIRIISYTGVRPGPTLYSTSDFSLAPGTIVHIERIESNNDPVGEIPIPSNWGCLGDHACFLMRTQAKEYAETVSCPK